MTRVKNSVTTKERHKKVLKAAKGYFGSKHRLYKTAKEQLMHSGQYAYRDRRQRKRDFRSLWITRINAACRDNDMSYSRFIEGLTKAGVEVNRKMLSEIAISDPAIFTEFVKKAKAALEGKAEKTNKEKRVEIEVLKVKEAPTKVEKEEVKTKEVKAVKEEQPKKVAVKKETVKEEKKDESKKVAVKKETVKEAKKEEPKKVAVKKETAKPKTVKKVAKKEEK